MDSIKFLELEADLFDKDYANEISLHDLGNIVQMVISLTKKYRILGDMEQERIKLAVLRLKSKGFFDYVDEHYNFLYRRIVNEAPRWVLRDWLKKTA